MTWEILHKNIPGFPDDQTLKITYVFPEGIQTEPRQSIRAFKPEIVCRNQTVQSRGHRCGIQKEKHPNPGQPYTGSQMCTYLPDNHEGKTVLTLLEKAFNQQLLFTIAIGESGDDVVTTASVPLKIQLEEEGSMIDGYPDMNYLMTLNKVLRNKGIK
ncbi:E3 ubiquitin-protein ligase DTX3L1 isoform X3 [Girardinichthys multiradiatus]|nr:E3 ubiquitin-protein ligase DTX3L1 isoform X3 [Girardinichthys multiradiatus]